MAVTLFHKVVNKTTVNIKNNVHITIGNKPKQKPQTLKLNAITRSQYDRSVSKY